jgi:hypothetical protein
VSPVRALGALFCFAACAGCDTMPKRVEVPIAVPCAAGLPVTRFTPFTKAELDGMNDGQWVQAVYLDRDLSARYVASLEGIVLACSSLPR